MVINVMYSFNVKKRLLKLNGLSSPPFQSHHGQLHFALDSPVYPLHLQSALMIAFCHLHRRHHRHPYLLMKKIKSLNLIFEKLISGSYTSHKLGISLKQCHSSINPCSIVWFTTYNKMTMIRMIRQFSTLYHTQWYNTTWQENTKENVVCRLSSRIFHQTHCCCICILMSY